MTTHSKPRVIGKWHQIIKLPNGPRHVIGIEKSSDGTYLAYTGYANAHDDPCGAHTRSERFKVFEDALKFVGWPYEFVPIPPELEAIR